jgi:predicted amidohydrolase
VNPKPPAAGPARATPPRWNYWTHTFDLSSNELIQANWVENSARVGHPELQPLLDCIKAAGVNVVLPMNERDNLGSQVRGAPGRSPRSVGPGVWGFLSFPGRATLHPTGGTGGACRRASPHLSAPTAFGPPRRRPPRRTARRARPRRAERRAKTPLLARPAPNRSPQQAAVFNAAVFIDSTGKVVARHRKLLPSFTERFWWTHGDGSDLVVVDMPGVGKARGMRPRPRARRAPGREARSRAPRPLPAPARPPARTPAHSPRPPRAPLRSLASTYELPARAPRCARCCAGRTTSCWSATRSSPRAASS